MAKTKKSFIERIKPTGAKDLIRKIILLVCICVFCYSAYNLASIFLEYKSMDDSNKEVEETYVTENTEQKNSYKTIDFEALLARNSDVKGWIDIPDTKVSYPIVQGETNDTYIHSDIDKKEFRAGSIFIASENKNPFTDLNTVIYGHNMKNTTMFSQLEKFKEESFFKSNPTITLTDKNGEKNYEVFAVLLVKKDYPYTIPNFNSDDEYNKFLNKIVDDSIFSTQNKPTYSDKILTLSTCSYEFKDARTVVFCKEKKIN